MYEQFGNSRNQRTASGVQSVMRYWAWLVAKVAVAGGILFFVRKAIDLLFPAPSMMYYSRREPFAHDLAYTLVMMLFFLLCAGVLQLIIWDQRARCRTCLRRLRMPVAAGSWSNIMLFGEPRTEYICLYGHGTLRVPEVDLTGSKQPDWQPHDDDIWKELESLESTNR